MENRIPRNVSKFWKQRFKHSARPLRNWKRRANETKQWKSSSIYIVCLVKKAEARISVPSSRTKPAPRQFETSRVFYKCRCRVLLWVSDSLRSCSCQKTRSTLSARHEVFSRLQPLTLCKNIEGIVQAVRSDSILRYLIENRKNKCRDESLFSSDQRAIVCNCTPSVT